MAIQERLKTIQKMEFIDKHKDYRKVILKFNNRRKSIFFKLLKSNSYKSCN